MTSLLFTLLCAGFLLGPTPAVPQAREVSAVHLVFEKPRKMKKVESLLFVPFLDQGQQSDTPDRPREVECTLVANGKRGELPVKGRLALRLVGSLHETQAIWTSSAVVAEYAGEEVVFAADDVARLVSAAQSARATVDLFRVEFDGGRGKKVTKLTLDCMKSAVSQ